MSLVIKLKTGDMALRAVPPAGEPTSDTLPPPEPALLDWAVLTPPSDDSHLAPCPRCGLPNGLSAASCWSCEANLLQLEPFRRRRSPRPAALASAHAPARDDESLPVLASAVEDNQPTAELPVAARRRHPWQTGVPILGVAVLAIAAFVFFDAPAPADAPKSGGGVVIDVPAPPAPAVLTGTRPVPGETRDAALRALAVEPDTATPAQAAQPAAPTLAPAPVEAAVQRSTARAGKPRSPARPPREATALAVPKPDRVDSSPSSWQPPLPARPCTATVAALGLCAAAPTVTKE
jgi:hypothetical protein